MDRKSPRAVEIVFFPNDEDIAPSSIASALLLSRKERGTLRRNIDGFFGVVFGRARRLHKCGRLTKLRVFLHRFVLMKKKSKVFQKITKEAITDRPHNEGSFCLNS